MNEAADVISSLRRDPRFVGPVRFTDIVRHTMRRKNISYRRHGQNGELLKPMHHRFDVKGGESNVQLMVRNLSMRNPLLERLSKR